MAEAWGCLGLPALVCLLTCCLASPCTRGCGVRVVCSVCGPCVVCEQKAKVLPVVPGGPAGPLSVARCLGYLLAFPVFGP